jgi:hypothetical protein
MYPNRSNKEAAGTNSRGGPKWEAGGLLAERGGHSTSVFCANTVPHAVFRDNAAYRERCRETMGRRAVMTHQERSVAGPMHRLGAGPPIRWAPLIREFYRSCLGQLRAVPLHMTPLYLGPNR